MSVIDFSIERTSAPAAEPLTLAEAKLQCQVADSDTAHDAALSRLIFAAREQLEHDTGLALVTQTWVQRHDDFPAERYIRLLRRPVQSITSVKYVDVDGAEQTWDASNYELDTKRPIPVVWLAHNVDWPVTQSIQNGVSVTFVAGFGEQSDVGELAKQAMLLLVGTWFSFREMSADQTRGWSTTRAYDVLANRLARSSYP